MKQKMTPESKMNEEMNGFFNDDGTKFNPNLTPAPALCATCRKNEDPKEEIPCNLTRNDQSGAERFICFAYESIRGIAETREILDEMQRYMDLKHES